jgi:hypothetical protein
MEDNLRQQLETTLSTCRRSPRILEQTVKQTPLTVRKQYVTDYKTCSRNDEQEFNSPEGIKILDQHGYINYYAHILDEYQVLHGI